MASEWKPPEFMQKVLSNSGGSFLLEKRRDTDRDLLKLQKTKKPSTPRKVTNSPTPKKKKRIKSSTPKANNNDRNRIKSNKQHKKKLDSKIVSKDKISKSKKNKSKQNKISTQMENENNNIKSTKIKKKKKKINESQKKVKKKKISETKTTENTQKHSVNAHANPSDNDDKFLNEMVSDMSTKVKKEMELILSDNEEDNNVEIPILPTDGSVDMLLNIDNNNDNIDYKQEEDSDEWNYDDTLKISDDEYDINDTNTLIIPTFELKTQGSVVDMLMEGPYNTNKDMVKQPINQIISVTAPEVSDNNIEKDYNIQIESTHNVDNNDNDNIEDDEWHYDDVLNISDDEEYDTNTNELIIPTFKLKTQGSVVDMLMAGPYINKKQNINTKISITQPQPTDDIIENDYNITISSNDDTKDEKQVIEVNIKSTDLHNNIIEHNITIKPSEPKRILKIISTEDRKGSFKKKMQKHTVYIIECNPPPDGIITVSRRYNDFKWLRNLLCLQFPGIFVPPLPPPKVIGRFDDSFVQQRRQDLERFLNRVEQIKSFAECQAFDMFLSHAIEKTFNEKRKKMEEQIKNRTKEEIALILNGLFPQLSQDSQQELDDKIYEDNIPKLKTFVINIDNQLSQINKSAVRLLKHFNSVPKEILLFKDALNGLNLTEINYPYKVMYKRFDVREQIGLWSSYQTKQTDNYYDNFFRLLRYEHEDIKAFLELFKYHQDLYKKYRKVCVSIEKWNQMDSNEVQLKLAQSRQKNIDFIDRKQLSLLLHIVTKIILKHEIILIWNNKMNLWKDRIQQFSNMHRQITNKMLNAWKIDNNFSIE